MERDERTSSDAAPQPAPGAAGGVTRSQNTVYTLPHDWTLIRRFLAPALERAQRAASGAVSGAAAESEAAEGTVLTPAPTTGAGPAVLVVTTDTEGALAVADTARRILGEHGPTFVPATAAGRASRLLRVGSPLGLSGSPAVLAELVRSSALKLDRVQAVVIAWADDILAIGGGADLEAVLGELPKEASRVLVAGEITGELEQLIERFMRRPRHITDAEAPAGEDAPLRVPVQYVTVSDRTRAMTLRRLLDELDPESLTVAAWSEEGISEVRLMLSSLGYTADDPSVRVGAAEVGDGSEGAAEGTPPSLVVLYELPSSPDQLRAIAAASPRQVVALVQPRQLGALHRLAGGEAAAYTLSDARRDARLREDSLQEELRAELAGGAPARELLALEPLLADYDGVELAAALLRMLEDERRRRPARRGAAAAEAFAEQPAAARAPAPWTRLYVNVGKTDNAGAGDILGALAGEADVPREKIGRIELRDNHSLVDVATDVAAQVVERASGAMIRGRRLVVREDKDRATGAPIAGGPPPRRSFGDRPERGQRFERGDRFERGARGERPERSGRFERGARPERGGRFERGGDRFERGERPDRGARFERGERSERGERPERGGQFERGGRPERGGGRFDRSDRGDRNDRGDRGGRPFRGARDERRDSYGRTLQDEQREWAQRGDRMRNARRPRPDERE